MRIRCGAYNMITIFIPFMQILFITCLVTNVSFRYFLLTNGQRGQRQAFVRELVSEILFVRLLQLSNFVPIDIQMFRTSLSPILV